MSHLQIIRQCDKYWYLHPGPLVKIYGQSTFSKANKFKVLKYQIVS